MPVLILCAGTAYIYVQELGLGGIQIFLQFLYHTGVYGITGSAHKGRYFKTIITTNPPTHTVGSIENHTVCILKYPGIRYIAQA